MVGFFEMFAQESIDFWDIYLLEAIDHQVGFYQLTLCAIICNADRGHACSFCRLDSRYRILDHH
jgi:hypothetical protein